MHQQAHRAKTTAAGRETGARSINAQLQIANVLVCVLLSSCGSSNSPTSRLAPPTAATAPTVLVDQSLPAAVVGEAYSATLSASGGTPPYAWSVTSGQLPAGFSLNPATGAIIGTDSTANGTFNFSVAAKDADGKSSAAAAQEIKVSAATLIITGALGSLTVTSPVNAKFTVSPATAGPYSWSVASGSLPTGLVLATSTANSVAITGAPTVDGQSYSFSLKVTDAETPTAGTGTSAVDSGEVGGDNAAPTVAANQSLPVGIIAAPYTGMLSAFGGTPPYLWSIASGSLPPNVTLNPATGAIAGTDTTVNGAFAFSVQVKDANGNTSAASAQSIKVSPAALAVVGTLGNLSVNSPVNAIFTASPATVGPYKWTVVSGTLPTGVTLSASSTNAVTVTGTPTNATQAYSFSLQVADSETPTAAIGKSVTQSGTVAAGGSTSAACPARGQEGHLAKASYAFFVRGFDGSGKPLVIAGSITADGSGKITSAELDYNGAAMGPQHLAPAQLSGQYSFGSDNRGCVALTNTGGNANVPATVVLSFALNGNLSNGRIIEFDDSTGKGIVATGSLAAQSSASFAAAFGSFYAMGLTGWDLAGGRFAMAGSFSTGPVLQGVTPIAKGYADYDDGGVVSGELTGGSGNISTASTVDGRANATLMVPNPNGQTLALDFVVYVVNASEWYLVTDDALNASTPFLASGRVIAAAGTYTGGYLNGYFMFGEEGFDLGNAGNDATIGVAQISTAGNVTNIAFYENDAGNFSANSDGVGTLAADTANPSSGRVSVVGLGNYAPIVYLCNALGSEQIAGFIVGTDPSASAGELVLQSPATPAFSSSSATGLFTFGSDEDLDNTNATYAGVFQLNGAGAYAFAFDVAPSAFSGPLFLESGVTGNSSYSVNANGTGTINGMDFYSVTNGQQFFVIPSAVDGALYVIQE